MNYIQLGGFYLGLPDELDDNKARQMVARGKFKFIYKKLLKLENDLLSQPKGELKR